MKWEVDTSDPMPGVMLRGRIIHKDCPNKDDDLWLCNETFMGEVYDGSGWRRFRTVFVKVQCQGCNAFDKIDLTEWAPERRNGNVP